METTYRVITPAQAETMLQNMIENRPCRKSVVQRYAQDMRDGRWLGTGETIKFTDDGQLVDGQHRLRAVVATGLPTEFCVAHGVSSEAFIAIDSGFKRTPGDVLKSGGTANATIVAGGARVILMYERWLEAYTVPTSSMVSTPMIVDCVQRYPELTDWAESLRPSLNRRVPKGLAPSACLAVRVLTSRVGSSSSETFFDKLMTGVDLVEGDVVLALRNRLQTLNFTSSQWHTVRVLAKAWNVYAVARVRVFRMPADAEPMAPFK